MQTSYGLGWGHLGPKQLGCRYFDLCTCSIITLLLIYLSNFLPALLIIASFSSVPSLPINLGKTAHKEKTALTVSSGGSFHGCRGLLTPQGPYFPLCYEFPGRCIPACLLCLTSSPQPFSCCFLTCCTAIPCDFTAKRVHSCFMSCCMNLKWPASSCFRHLVPRRGTLWGCPGNFSRWDITESHRGILSLPPPFPNLSAELVHRSSLPQWPKPCDTQEPKIVSPFVSVSLTATQR